MNMKKRNTLFTMAALLVMTAVTLVGCIKKYDLHVSSQDLWFGFEAESQTIEVTANCKWTVTFSDNETWYTITPDNGKKDGTITVSVEPMENEDFRSTYIVVTSPGGHIRRTVFISQNKLEFHGLINKIFGVMHLEHWNTDYFGEIIEDTYHDSTYNPYDTTTGYHLYFLENGEGVQRDHHTDTIAFWPFHYEYDPMNQILHFEFELMDGSPENYDVNVLTASDSLYRFIHEWQSHFWERADMRKVGVITPQEYHEIMKALSTRQRVVKREKGSPIFIMD